MAVATNESKKVTYQQTGSKKESASSSELKEIEEGKYEQPKKTGVRASSVSELDLVEEVVIVSFDGEC